MGTSTGTPVTGYVSLSSGTPGPVAFTLFTVMGQAAYTLDPKERVYITSIVASTNDTTQRLVTVDTGGTTPTTLVSAYLTNTLPPLVESIPPGACRGIFGSAPRASAPAVTAAKSIECTLVGYVSRS